MAKRRALARALSGLGEGIGNAGTFMFRQSQQERMQDRYDTRQAATQEAMDARAAAGQVAAAVRAIREKVASGEYEPAQAEAMIRSVQGNAASSEDIRPSPRRRIENSVGKRIMDADDPAKVPSPDDIFGDFAAQGVESRVQLPAEWSAGMLPADDPYANATDLAREYGIRARSKQTALESKPTEKFNVTNPDGSESTTFGNAYSGPVQTKPTSEQQGVLAGTQDAAKQKTILGDEKLTALTGQAQARIANIVESLTRGEKVKTAAATAGASKRATLSPDIIASEVSRQSQLNAGKENATEGERRAASNFTPLINAHGQLLNLEASGVRVRTGMQTASQSPSLNFLVPETQQQYLQAGRDFVSTLGLIRSGVAVPETEVTRFVSTMLGTSSDTPQTLKNKQSSREVFIGAMQAMVGRSGDEAGRLLANLYDGGNVPDGLALKLDPAIEQGLLKNMRSTPKFDANGNFIGVVRKK